MAFKEVNFELLDFVQTSDGRTLSIGFKDNEKQKMLSQKTAHSMYQQGIIIKKSEEVEGETVFEDLAPY